MAIAIRVSPSLNWPAACCPASIRPRRPACSWCQFPRSRSWVSASTKPAWDGTASSEGFFPEDQSFNPASIGLDTGVTSAYNYGLPKISVGGFAADRCDRPAFRATASTPTGTSSITMAGNRAAHDLKVGYEFRRTTIRLVQDNNFRGKLSFSGDVGQLRALTRSSAAVPDWWRQNRAGYTHRHPSKTTRASISRTASAGTSASPRTSACGGTTTV